MYANKTIDARTFVQIWDSLSPNQQALLRYELTKRGDPSRASLYNWTKGMRPVSQTMRNKVSRLINKLFGIETHPLTLFPTR